MAVQKGKYRNLRSKPTSNGKHVVGKQSVDHVCWEHPCSDEGACWRCPNAPTSGHKNFASLLRCPGLTQT